MTIFCVLLGLFAIGYLARWIVCRNKVPIQEFVVKRISTQPIEEIERQIHAVEAYMGEKTWYNDKAKMIVARFYLDCLNTAYCQKTVDLG